MAFRSVSRCLAVLAGLLMAAFSLAQQGEVVPQPAGPGGQVLAPARAEAPNYGTTKLTYVRVTGLEFFPGDGSGYGSDFGLGRFPRTYPIMYAALHLPGGSIIDYLEIDFCDFFDPQDILLHLLDCGALGTDCVTVANVNSFAAPGCSQISTSGINHQVDNVGGSLALEAIFQELDSGLLSITGAIVGYRLQVSPDPGYATFTDVPVGHGFHRFVEALYAAGITAGYPDGRFGVNDPITRGQMAVFLSTALGLQFP